MENDELARWTDHKLAALDPTDAGVPAAPRPGTRSPHRLMWTAGAAAAVFAASMTFPGPRALAERCLQCLPFAAVQTAPETQRPPAPDFALRDSAGRTVTLAELRGRPVIVNFWASWCPPCRTETPLLVDLHRRHAAAGLVVIGVNFDGDWTKANAFASSVGAGYTMVAGDDAAAKAYRAQSLPVTVMIDREGRVAARFEGPLPAEAAEREVAKLLETPR